MIYFCLDFAMLLLKNTPKSTNVLARYMSGANCSSEWF